MFLRLLLLFTIVPVTELYLFIEVGSRIGTLTTIGIVILTGVVGAGLARAQGFSTLQRIQAATARGEMPADEMVDAVLIFVAGVVLLTPGFLTDFMGLLLLIPFTRTGIKAWAKRAIARGVKSGNVNVHFSSGFPGQDGFGQNGFGQGFPGGFQRPGRPDDSDVYDAEFTETSRSGSRNSDPDKKGLD